MTEQLTFAPSNNIENSLRFLRDNCPDDGYLIGFSGGKDSLAVLEACKEARVPYRYYMKITTVDPPELIKYVKRCHPECLRLPPPGGESMYEMVERRGLPTRLHRWCCKKYKEYPADIERGGHVLIGVRAAESAARKKRSVLVRACMQTGGFIINPILYWTDADVWEYIRAKGAEYCGLYDEGFKRIGCIGCPLASNTRWEEFARWPWSYAKYRLAIREYMKRGRAKGVGILIAWVGWKPAKEALKHMADEGATVEQIKAQYAANHAEALLWHNAQDPEYLVRRVMAWWLECPVDYWKLDELERYAHDRQTKDRKGNPAAAYGDSNRQLGHGVARGEESEVENANGF